MFNSVFIIFTVTDLSSLVTTAVSAVQCSWIPVLDELNWNIVNLNILYPQAVQQNWNDTPANEQYVICNADGDIYGFNVINKLDNLFHVSLWRPQDMIS